MEAVATDLLLQVEDLHKSFDGRLVLKGVNLEVPRGSVFSVLGPSGAGKSVFLKCLAHVLTPDAGRIRFDGRLLGAGQAAAQGDFQRRCSFLFQNNALFDSLTALENVALPLEFLDHEDAYTEARKALAEVGLSHRESHFPGQLSGGEQQRVAIARALAPRPTLILADEPTGNLDLATGAEVMDLLFGLREKTGATLLLITHDAALAKRCGRIVHLADGRIVSAGAKRKVTAT